MTWMWWDDGILGVEFCMCDLMCKILLVVLFVGKDRISVKGMSVYVFIDHLIGLVVDWMFLRRFSKLE